MRINVRQMGRRRSVRVAMLALLLAGIFWEQWIPISSGETDADLVVILHGLGRSSRSMRSMERALAAEGYRVRSVPYPSRHKTIEKLVEEDLAPALTLIAQGESVPVHFVTHSLGGIMVRQYLATPPSFEVGRVVMLAPPNRGSELSDRLGHFRLFKWVNGPVGDQLRTTPDAVPAQLPLPDYPVGVIAGTKSLNPFYSRFIPGPDDGKVSVERARLEGMADLLEVPYSHTWLMNRRAVQRQVIHFLAHGMFSQEL